MQSEVHTVKSKDDLHFSTSPEESHTTRENVKGLKIKHEKVDSRKFTKLPDGQDKIKNEELKGVYCKVKAVIQNFNTKEKQWRQTEESLRKEINDLKKRLERYENAPPSLNPLITRARFFLKAPKK